MTPRALVQLVLIVGLAACERATPTQPEPRPHRWRAPNVGESGDNAMTYTMTLTGPDGRVHVVTQTTESTSKILALDGHHTTRLRTTFVRDDVVRNGTASPGMSGTFELAETPTGVDITKVGGAITTEERAWFADAYHASRAATVAYEQMMDRPFVVGDHWRLSPDEMIGIGLGGTRQIELTVRDVTPTAVRFGIALENDLGSGAASGTLTATGTLLLSDRDSELISDGDLRHGDTPVGTVHIEQRSHLRP